MNGGPSRYPASPPRQYYAPDDPRSIDPRLPIAPSLPPPAAPIPSLSSLSPALLSSLRLNLMRTIARAPTDAELVEALPSFLRKKRKDQAKEIKNALKKVELRETKRAMLDNAWIWSKTVEEEAGLPRAEVDREEDAKVEERIKERKEREAEKELIAIERTVARARALEHLEGTRSELNAPASPPPPPSIPLKNSSTFADGTEKPEWRKHKETIQTKFPKGWLPPKRISREAIDLIRLLQKSDPQQFTTPILADKFKISPEAVRRILKSQFALPAEEVARREKRRKEEREREREDEPWAGDLFSERHEMIRLKAASKVIVPNDSGR